MRFEDYQRSLKADFMRYISPRQDTIRSRFLTYFSAAGCQWSFWFRTVRYLRTKKWLRIFYYMSLLKFRRVSIKYGIDISSNLKKCGNGLAINHYSCIVVHANCELGEEVTLRQGVTIGTNGRGEPVLGNNVDVGAGTAIIGNVHIGNNVVIGANSVVTHDVPDNAIVAGNPARILRFRDDEKE